jgi:hypothetical protein
MFDGWLALGWYLVCKRFGGWLEFGRGWLVDELVVGFGWLGISWLLAGGRWWMVGKFLMDG